MNDPAINQVLIDEVEVSAGGDNMSDNSKGKNIALLLLMRNKMYPKGREQRIGWLRRKPHWLMVIWRIRWS